MSTQIPITADDILKIVEVMKKHEIKPLRVGDRLTARLMTANDPIGRVWKVGDEFYRVDTISGSFGVYAGSKQR